jgi:hypothetical protein
MQLTKIDRWLREKFIYRTHIYTMRLPETGLPSSILVEELEESPTRKFRYRLIANADNDVRAVISTLKAGNQMFATRIEEANPWYKKIIAPEGKSFFFRVVWIGVTVVTVISVISACSIALSNPEFRGQLMEAIDLFING